MSKIVSCSKERTLNMAHILMSKIIYTKYYLILPIVQGVVHNTMLWVCDG
jgi:hypothetical protein